MTFSTSYGAKKKRIKRLPQFLGNAVKAQAKRDAVGVIAEFQEGIARNSFRLDKLQASTIRQKKRQGYKRPRTPLYGLGEGRRAYRNMMIVRTRGKSYVVRPSTRMHHGSGMKMNALFTIHEFGATIRRTNGKFTRIPARPAFSRAFQRHLRKRKRLEPTQEVRRAMNEYINDAKANTFRRIAERNVTREFDE